MRKLKYKTIHILVLMTMVALLLSWIANNRAEHRRKIERVKLLSQQWWDIAYEIDAAGYTPLEELQSRELEQASRLRTEIFGTGLSFREAHGILMKSKDKR